MTDATLRASLAPPTTDEDEALARAVDRDPDAFADIYERHGPAVYRYLRSRSRSDDEAADLAAVTFERALAGIDGYTSRRGSLGPWLIRIARNAHLDAARQRDRHPTVALVAERDAATTHTAGHEDAVILRSLVDALPATQREAIQLRYAAGLTAREIGEVLGLSEAAAQKQLERALAALKETFHDA